MWVDGYEVIESRTWLIFRAVCVLMPRDSDTAPLFTGWAFHVEHPVTGVHTLAAFFFLLYLVDYALLVCKD